MVRLMDKLEKFCSVTKVRQGDGITINGAKSFLDVVIKEFFETGIWLTPTAYIVYSQRFRIAIAKVHERQEDELSEAK